MTRLISAKTVPLLLTAWLCLGHVSIAFAQISSQDTVFRERRRFEIAGTAGYRWKGPSLWYVNADYSSVSYFPYLGLNCALSVNRWLTFTHQLSFQSSKVTYELESPVYNDKRDMGISDRFNILENTVCFQANDGPFGIYVGMRLVSTLNVKRLDIYDRKIPLPSFRQHLPAFCGGINFYLQKNIELFGQMAYGLSPLAKGIMFESSDQTKLRYVALEVALRYRLASFGKATGRWEKIDVFKIATDSSW